MCVCHGKRGVSLWGGEFQRPLTLILLQKYRDTNGSRIAIQIGAVHTTLCQEEGILLQKYRDRTGRCIAILFKSIGVRGRFHSPDIMGRGIPISAGEVPKPGCFKTGCLQFLGGSALLRPFAGSFAPFCGLAFALFCAHLCPTAFRTTAFGNCRM